MTQQAENYGKVLFEMQIPEEEVEKLNDLIVNSPEFMSVLLCPTISYRKKAAMIDSIAACISLSKEVKNFVKLVCKDGYSEDILDSCKMYHELMKKEQGVLSCTLFYVTMPAKEQLQKMEEFLKKKYSCKIIQMELLCKPELVGGFVLKVGNEEIDQSILGRKKKLQERLCG